MTQHTVIVIYSSLFRYTGFNRAYCHVQYSNAILDKNLNLSLDKI